MRAKTKMFTIFRSSVLTFHVVIVEIRNDSTRQILLALLSSQGDKLNDMSLTLLEISRILHQLAATQSSGGSC